MSVENKKDNLTTKSITRSQTKNNPKLAKIIEDNRKKTFEIKKEQLKTRIRKFQILLQILVPLRPKN